MMAECGFKKDVALLAAAALAEDCNKKFGDNIDPNFCVRAVATFINNKAIGINCRHCGWRKPKTQFCTQRNCNTGDGQTCDLFRHLFVVEPE
jgi:hypothetical protein